MSIARSCYLGPFVLCSRLGMGQKRVLTSVWGCKKCGTVESARRVSFCPHCGEKLKTYESTNERPAVIAFEMVEELNERLTTANACGNDIVPGFDIFIPNVEWDGCNKSAWDGSYTEVDADFVSRQSTSFERAFSSEIAILRKAYGQAKVFLRYGLVPHAS